MTATPSEPDQAIIWPARTPAGRARAAAIAASEPLPEPMEWVEYRSGGRLLIIGPADAAWPIAAVLRESLDCAMLATAPPSEAPDAPPPVRYLDGRPVDLHGHLGAFELKVEVERGRILDAAVAFGMESGIFDLVLDLDGAGELRMDIHPPGYVLATTPEAREAALEELPQMTGEFQKARYFVYDPEICAHGSRGLTGCTNCLDACATEAIRSLGELIEIDPYLCQGVGSCVTRCPSGAIQYQAPPTADLLDVVRRLVRDYRAEADELPAPDLLFYSAESAGEGLAAQTSSLPEHVLPVGVEDVGAIGMDVWLTVLAYGAGRVLLLPGPAPAPSLVQASRSSIDVAQAVLSALDPKEQTPRLVWLDSPSDAREFEPLMPLVDPPAGFGGLGSKRERIRRALEFLHASAVSPEAEVRLPMQAAYGAVEVDRDACTLCMGCVSVCPASALQGGGEEPRLAFREDHCLQCGLCEQACPENAISLQRRMKFEAHLKPSPQTLNEAPMHHCPGCGKAFATVQMIERMTERLSSHWMYQDDRSRERLMLCEDCRIRKMWDDEGGIDVHPKN